MKRESIIRCVDVIARRGDAFVVIERLSDPVGLAFPGGKIDPGETPAACAVREFGEETGFALTVDGIVGFYDACDRDPRGRYVSTLMHGHASGSVQEEPGKTRVHCMDEIEIRSRHAEFVSDHYRMFSDYRRNAA